MVRAAPFTHEDHPPRPRCALAYTPGTSPEPVEAASACKRCGDPVQNVCALGPVLKPSDNVPPRCHVSSFERASSSTPRGPLAGIGDVYIGDWLIGDRVIGDAEHLAAMCERGVKTARVISRSGES